MKLILKINYYPNTYLDVRPFPSNILVFKDEQSQISCLGVKVFHLSKAKGTSALPLLVMFLCKTTTYFFLLWPSANFGVAAGVEFSDS
ncbi:hypothetical protein QL285_029356 [Trifolium repens]|jgi:hypothetical protein|nr:hypothetical protein QL285_029356 [Trifolium repens]